MTKLINEYIDICIYSLIVYTWNIIWCRFYGIKEAEGMNT